ncbi:hypothetical protein LUZ60_016852 [Juncus effusus]|nr:hypothetical protein LUZ60_016852 [Juncus effusus]
MGSCTSSLFHTSTSIQRCKSRRHLMIQTIRSFKNLGLAHHAYFRSLRQMAASLIVFASGEPLYVSDVVPPLFIQYPVSEELSSHKAIPVGTKQLEKSKDDQEAKSVEVRMAVRHRNLAEIAAAIGESFIKVSDAGEAFLDHVQIRPYKKKSKGLLRMFLSRSRSRKLQDVQYQLEATGIQGSEGQKSHSSTLEKLLAFEKKLYEEVKMRERLKIKLEKKQKYLESQELKYNGIEGSSRQEKKEASMNKLRLAFRIASEEVSNTSSAIIRTRDHELAPQLTKLCNGMLNMWRRMNHFHYTQFLIIQQVGGLVNQSTDEPTTDLHHAATCQLEAAISNWHFTFQQMIKCQRVYIHSLHNWLRLTIVNFNDPSVKLAESLNKWNGVLDQLPDLSVSEAIQRFLHAVHVINVKQAEEVKTKLRVVKYGKKLERKSKHLTKMEKRYYKTYRRDADTRARVDYRDYKDYQLDYERQVNDEKREKERINEKKREIKDWLRKVDEETKRHIKAVSETRKLALNGIKMSLPSVFQAMARVSGLFVEGLESVYRNPESCQTSVTN